ncbi:MAG: glycosyltransferase family 2 protein [Chlorobi bacterium]|nr:glycosyltransferase family 2 protein [Chlorobiota bacterium]
MKVTGFTFVRNAVILDYPVEESIRSVLPLVDDFVVAVGESDDNTLELIQNIDPEKIRIIRTRWDENLRREGKVLADETNKALRAVPADSDWAFYIQADEVVHEEDYDNIRRAMLRYKDCPEVDGLLFDYVHFYGSYDWVGAAYSWYRHEVRIIRNDKNIYSYRDAQGFRKNNGEKLRVVPARARIFHYGWVRDPAAMERKQRIFVDFWKEQGHTRPDLQTRKTYDYGAEQRALKPFRGTHPRIMQRRIQQKNWPFRPAPGYDKLSLKDRLKALVEKTTGHYIGFKNYKKINPHC